MSEFESIIKQLGSFGPYQRRVFILVSMFETPAAWAMLIPIFLTVVPEWECPLYNIQGNTVENFSTISNQSSNTSSDSNFTRNSCGVDGVVCPGIRFTGEFKSIVSEWSLVCDMKGIPGNITTIQMGGLLIGALIMGQLADIFGRKKTLFIAYFLLSVFSFGSAFVNSWQLFAMMRFFIGGLVGSVLVVNFVLPLEFVTPSWRTFCGCIGFWAVGLMTLALWGFFIKDWRTLVISTSVTGVFILLSWWFVPESPRWLLSKGRIQEAKDILKQMAVYNKKDIPDLSVLELYVEKERKKREARRHYSYWHLFKSWKMTRNSLIVMYGWFVSSSVYYGLNFNTNNLAGDLCLNVFISGFVEIPALIYVVVFNNRLGRRIIVLSLMLLSGISSLAVMCINLIDKSQTTLIIVIAMIGKSGISGGWAATQVFSAETFPTVVRNIGIGACAMAARIGGIIAPQIVLVGTNTNRSVPFAVFGILAVLCGILMLCLPETNKQPLQDTLAVESPSVRETSTAKHQNGSIHEEIPLQQTSTL